MEQYISKSALVAEIERMIKHYNESAKEFGDEGYNDNVLMEQCKANACKHILSFIDTLEVKGVGLPNFEQEVKEFCYRFDDRKESWYNMTPHDKNIMVSPTWSNFAMQIAKHFFELGLNAAQKGERV